MIYKYNIVYYMFIFINIVMFYIILLNKSYFFTNNYYTLEMYVKCKNYKIPIKKIDNLISEDNNSNKITAKFFIK